MLIVQAKPLINWRLGVSLLNPNSIEWKEKYDRKVSRYCGMRIVKKCYKYHSESIVEGKGLLFSGTLITKLTEIL